MMETLSKMTLNLQFFADGGENQAGNQQDGAQNTQTTTEQAQGTPAQQGNQPGQIPANLAGLLIQALETRTARAEKSVTRSIAEQYGVSEEVWGPSVIELWSNGKKKRHRLDGQGGSGYNKGRKVATLPDGL